MGKKKFIDKKKDKVHSFKVVHRSQRDPLITDEAAPQAVLVQQETKKETEEFGIYFDDDYDYLQHLRGTTETVEWEEGESEIYSIAPDKAANVGAKDKPLMLPSSIFESHVEEPVGLLNKALPLTGPRPELDPDVIAKLYDSGSENDFCDPDDEAEFPDDFVTLMNSEEPIPKNLEDPENGTEFSQVMSRFKFGNDYRDDEDTCSINSDFRFNGSFNERSEDDQFSEQNLSKVSVSKSHFTEHSLTCSVVPRNHGLTFIDEQFEALYLREYGDEQIGALDGEDIEGHLHAGSKVISAAVAEVQEIKDGGIGDIHPVIEWIKNTQNLREGPDEFVEIEMPMKYNYDCESVRSSIPLNQNFPKLIDEDYFGGSRRKQVLTKRALANFNKEIGYDNRLDDEVTVAPTLLSNISAISIRPAGETPEERRERKTAIKELRRERRIEKKLNKLSFKEEKKIQERTSLNRRFCKKVSVW